MGGLEPGNMWVKVDHKFAVKIHDDVIRDVLDIYPEEELEKRRFFTDAFDNGYLSYVELLKECESIQIPWQMFFLTPGNLKKQLDHISKERKFKFTAKFFSKRKGVGDITSKRIIDRLIRLQNYVLQNFTLTPNNFCGALKGKSYSECVNVFLNYFEIDVFEFRSKKTDKAFDYLIGKIETKSVNISRGVLKGGVLPEVKNVNDVYKNTSGFVVRNECLPFIFLPDDLNPDEAMGRRIYTLIYLLTCVGLDDYDFYLENSFKASALKKKGGEAIKHGITTAILFPEEETDLLREAVVGAEDVAKLSAKFKITPTAVVVTLKRRGVITQEEYEELLPPPFKPQKKTGEQHGQRPLITTAVKKFCGSSAFSYVNAGIRSGSLKSIQAQYLIFGHVHKNQYKKYCFQIGL